MRIIDGAYYQEVAEPFMWAGRLLVEVRSVLGEHKFYDLDEGEFYEY